MFVRGSPCGSGIRDGGFDDDKECDVDGDEILVRTCVGVFSCACVIQKRLQCSALVLMTTSMPGQASTYFMMLMSMNAVMMMMMKVMIIT